MADDDAAIKSPERFKNGDNGSEAHLTKEVKPGLKFNRWSQQLAEQPHLSELYYRGINDFESLEGAELVRFTIIMSQLFRNYEDAYYGQLEGHLDARVWHSWEAAMRDINAYPGVQAWWRSRSHWYSEEGFANYINQLQQTAGPPRLYREPMEDE